MNKINSIKKLPVNIFLLTAITAGVHLYLWSQPDEQLRYFFLLNGFGYLILLGAFLLPRLKSFHSLVRLVFLGYVLLTIILWFFLGSPHEGSIDPFDVLTKLVELTLAVNLFFDIK